MPVQRLWGRGPQAFRRFSRMVRNRESDMVNLQSPCPVNCRYGEPS